MRIALFSILLLQAVSAFAQATVGAEVVSDPLLYPSAPVSIAVPAVAMAKDRTGVAIAWAALNLEQGGDRISMARLDATGHIAGSVRSVPAVFPGTEIEQLQPSLAPDPGGDGFALVWVEHPRSDSRGAAVYCRLDKDLNPSAVSILQYPTGAVHTPAIVRSGKTVWITAGASAWQVKADGSIDAPLNAGLPACDMAVATDFPQLVSGQRVFTGTTCRPDPGCLLKGNLSTGWICLDSCKIQNYAYSLQFVALYTLSAGKSFGFVSDAEPAIESDGRDELIVWFRGTQGMGGDVVVVRLNPSTFTDFSHAADDPVILATFGPDAGQTRPDIATDGERYVVVWRTNSNHGDHDIVGASIDRAGNVIPLSIATTVADERDPSVIAIGPGKFLVAYEKHDADRRIAGRFVTFDHRSRAVR